VKPGDLVKSNRFVNKVGVVVDIFGDLNPEDPWVRVRWTIPVHSFEWCKQQGLSIISKNEEK